jgi:non-heme chloroperoxidase
MNQTVTHTTSDAANLMRASRREIIGGSAAAIGIAPIPPTTVKTLGASERSTSGGKTMSTDRTTKIITVKDGAHIFYKEWGGGFNRPNAKLSEPILANWSRQAMAGDVKAQDDCVTAFSATNFTEDPKKIAQPSLVILGEDDQIAPVEITAELAVTLLKNGTLKTYPGYPHGMATAHSDVINADMLAFVRA